MKKSLLIWGALVVIALCFVGCCYYNTNHCHHHCQDDQCNPAAAQKCPDSKDAAADDEVDTVTVEAVEIVPLDAPAANNGQKKAPAKPAPAK